MRFEPEAKIENAAQFSPLTLAFIGDGVYELYVRSRLVRAGNIPASRLHVLAISYVRAAAQAESIHAILDRLSEEELAIYKRGRNAKSATVPKNAVLSDYRAATGFEALLGYLYLIGRYQRLDEVMKLSYDVIAQKLQSHKED